MLKEEYFQWSASEASGILENELSSIISRSPKNRRQMHSSQNFALEPAITAIRSYSWASVGITGMLLILCWHGCSYSVACWNRQVCVLDGQRLS